MENQQEVRSILIKIAATLESIRQRLPQDEDSYHLIDQIEDIERCAVALSQGE